MSYWIILETVGVVHWVMLWVPTFDTVSFSTTLVQTKIVHHIFLWGRDPSYSHPHLHIGNHLCNTFQLDAFQSFKFPTSVSS